MKDKGPNEKESRADAAVISRRTYLHSRQHLSPPPDGVGALHLCHLDCAPLQRHLHVDRGDGRQRPDTPSRPRASRFGTASLPSST